MLLCHSTNLVSELRRVHGTGVGDGTTEHELTGVLVNGARTAASPHEAISPGGKTHFVLLSHGLTGSVVRTGRKAIQKVVLSGGTLLELEDHVGSRDARAAARHGESSGVAHKAEN